LADPEPYLNPLFLLQIFKPLTIGIVINFLILLFLLLISALISGSEVAFFSLNPTEKEELDKKETKASIKAKDLLENPKRLLATILISNNFINVGIIILSTYSIGNLIDFSSVATWFSFGIQVVGITFIILLFGEVIPKVYATKHALAMARLMAYPLHYLKNLFKPISYLLITSSSVIDKGIKKKSLAISVEELSHALDLTEGIPENEDEHKILKGIVRFGETSVKQVMKARVEVTAIDKETSFSEIINTIIESGHSRIPVYENSFDKILGILYIKDLLSHIQEDEDFKWLTLIRDPFYVPENKKLDDLLKDFQTKKVHLAIVVDEYGGTSGIITLEDILEEIVGEISDEFDDEDIIYSKLDERNYVFDGKTALNDVYKILNFEDVNYFDEVKKDADSLAGLIIEIAEKIPLKNEKVSYKEFTFTIEASDKRRIKRIKLTITK
jgi:magnesium and cobalt exporter, CNNM family